MVELSEITHQLDAQIKSIITPQTGVQIDKNIIKQFQKMKNNLFFILSEGAK